MAHITKKQIAEQAMRIIAGGHRKPDNPIDIREVMLFVDQVRDEMIKNSVNGSVVSFVDPEYVTYFYDVLVESDESRTLRYIALPSNIISLPRNMGVYSISPMLDTTDQYIPIPFHGTWLYKDTQAMTSTSLVKYWLERDQVYFKNLDPGVTHLLVGLVESSKSILETAEYPIPPDTEKEIVKQVVQMFGIEQQQPRLTK